MALERRVRDRDTDAASNRWLRKAVVLAVLATVAVWLLAKYARIGR